jgi:AcrR family transcriptional regulator
VASGTELPSPSRLDGLHADHDATTRRMASMRAANAGHCMRVTLREPESRTRHVLDSTRPRAADEESAITSKPHDALRGLLVGAPRPLLPRSAEAALGERHRELLDALEQLLQSGELARYTVGELAAHLGCSRRTLYELAPSKDALHLLVYDRMMHNLGRAAMGAVDATAPAVTQLRQYATTNFGYSFQSGAYDDLLEVPGVRRTREQHFRFAATILERILANGIASGEFRAVDSSVAAHMILVSSVHLANPDVLDDLHLAHEDAKAAMIDVVLSGLVTPAKPPDRT